MILLHTTKAKVTNTSEEWRHLYGFTYQGYHVKFDHVLVYRVNYMHMKHKCLIN